MKRSEEFVPVEGETDQVESSLVFNGGDVVNILFTFPKGRGVALLHALKTMALTDFSVDVMEQIADDPSVLELLKEQAEGEQE